METNKINFNDFNNNEFKPWDMEKNTFCMLMHLSQFASLVFPFAGIILPLVMWQQYKDRCEIINQNGRNIFNFILSYFIYSIILGFIVFFFVFAGIAAQNSGVGIISVGMGLIGLLLAGLVGIGYFVVVILAAIKANNGEVGSYPLVLNLIK